MPESIMAKSNKNNMGQKKCTLPANTGMQGKKTPRMPVDPLTYEFFAPSWRFNRCDTEKWTFPAEIFVEKILPILLSLERMTWSDIKKATHDQGKSKSHPIPINELNREAQARLRELHLSDEYNEIFSLRLNNKYRIFGFLDRGTLEILWFDPNHEVVPVQR